MASSENHPRQHIVRADEVDQTGTDISPVPDEQLMPNVVREFKEEQARRQDDDFSEFPQRHPRQPVRPELRRDAIAPPPPLQPPPPAPLSQGLEAPADPLSLAQLRKIVQDIPKIEDQPAYAFAYADFQPFPIELDEWFRLDRADRFMLNASRESFQTSWNQFSQDSNTSESTWLSAPENRKKAFVEKLVPVLLQSTSIFERLRALETLCYLITGVWGVSAGRTPDNYPSEPSDAKAAETPKEKSLQIWWIERNIELLQQAQMLDPLFGYFQRVFDKDKMANLNDSKPFDAENRHVAYSKAHGQEMNLILTIFYFIVEVARRQELVKPEKPILREAFAALKPNYLATVAQIIARLRWEDVSEFPLTRLILLFWKSILLLFGGSDSLRHAKSILEPEYDRETSSLMSPLPILTASPLDYHTFRQEITSKYPSYNLPPALLPLELEHNSILPPLPNVAGRVNSLTLFSGVSPSSGLSNGSILHKSVHIATPAPSPPPSPGGPGKTGKKQNYQTNQHFPFIYPPLDSTSNNLGGKGSSELQDTLVGQKWKGSDVPASIIEAGKLFSSRMRMTRALRQLWEEREEFMMYDRGWDENKTRPSEDEGESAGFQPRSVQQEDLPAFAPDAKENRDQDVSRRLDAVEEFYRLILPNLQSVIIVLLKEILTNITAVVGNPAENPQNDHRPGMGPNGINGVQHAPNEAPSARHDLVNPSDPGEVRYREIKDKAISGSLLLLLKWFKRSHILQFEYMSQLLLDSNYLPLILKMFVHQDVDKTVARQNDQDIFSFWHFCLSRALHDAGTVEESEEEAAVPPPISRSRSSFSVLNASVTSSERDQDDGPYLPEVDELGFPTAPLPKSPITEFSFRNFFSAINYLHIMQKVTHKKAHRCLLLVQYKSSAVLRKGIKVPNHHLRLYTLKLFKSQVPYCGRKWRQAHMRIITAIYLYCRPELRDDWLSGADIDAEVEDSLPMEQALRGLTHWWHLRKYKDSMAVKEGQALMDEERDFFSRELENMGWGIVGEEGDNGVNEEANAVGVANEIESVLPQAEQW